MKHHRRAILPVASLLIVLGAIATWWSITTAAQEMRHLATLLVVTQGKEKQAVKTTWTSNGSEHSITTPKIGGETLEQWQNRHFEAVRQAQAVIPPD